MSIHKLLKEYYYTASLPEKKRVKAELISLYWNKCSDRLHKEHAELMIIGQEEWAKTLQQVMTARNPFLDAFRKAGVFSPGKYLPIPLVYGIKR